MDPVTILQWAYLILELGSLTTALLDLGRRIRAGETVTWAQLEAAATDSHAAHDELDAALTQGAQVRIAEAIAKVKVVVDIPIGKQG
jgi:hypothetical protein